MWQKMYLMELGESIMNLPDNNSLERLTRVPGGWVYAYGNMHGTSTVFIPWDNEYQPVFSK